MRYALAFVFICLLMLPLGARGEDVPFELIVTQFPPGPNIPESSWGGISVFRLKGDGAPAETQAELAASDFQDPSGLAYFPEKDMFFVGNRFGNNGNGAVYPVMRQAGGNGFEVGTQLPANRLRNVHQVAINPVTHELFVANLDGPISRYVMDGDSIRPHGTIGAGRVLGVTVSADGKRLYTSGGSSVITQWDVNTGREQAQLNVPGARDLDFMRMRGEGELFVADNKAGLVYRFAVNQQHDLELEGSLPAANCLGVAFSPDLNELFVSTHNVQGSQAVIYRFRYDAAVSDWNLSGTIRMGKSMGDILTIPLAAAPAVAAPDLQPIAAAPAAAGAPDSAVSGGWNIVILLASVALALFVLVVLGLILVLRRARRVGVASAPSTRLRA